MDIPRRNTLQSQTAALIRRQLREGHWTGALPGELFFAGQFHVSRVTVRLALAELKREGLVAIVRHRYRPVAAKPRMTGQPNRFKSPPLRVGYLCPHPVDEVMLRKLREIHHLQRTLQDLSIQLILVPDTLVGRRHDPSSRLASLTRENPAACWVLGLCPAPVQRWFAQMTVPAIISGSAHAGIGLPYFNWDHRAIGRHAAGALRTRGHRRIALLTPERRFAGDLESEAGFIDGAAPDATHPRPAVYRHDGTPDMIRRISRSLMTRETPPSALVTLHALDALTVLTTLQQEGFQVPGRMSLISLQGDPMLEHLTPAIAHYEWRSDLLVKRLTAAILQLVNKSGKPAPALLTSRFCPGESLGRLPAGA